MKIKNTRQRTIVIVLFSAIIFVIPFLSECVKRNSNINNKNRETIQEMVVLSKQSDPYHPLAQRIAHTEKNQITENMTQALELNPRFILLVASPENLTEERLVSIGRMFKRLDTYPALGIITGSTMEKAEQLWMRSALERNSRYYLGSDIEKAHLITKPAIFSINENSETGIALNKNKLTAVLTQADYFYWARHVTADKWFWNTESEDYGEDDKLYASDLPDLNSVVIYTPSCGSFQPWVENSIALGFVDKGAACYIGHVHSPYSNNFLMRHQFTVPGVYTWEEFPLGIMAQVQNRMTARTAHKTPLFFMLGDPRIFLSESMPYQISLDAVSENGKREIVGVSNNEGVLAIKIENGAEYKYLKIVGNAAASDNDLFYNNNLQMLNLGADKYILSHHQGGEFHIKLSHKAPFMWILTDAAIDALDYSWVAIGVIYSPLALVLSVILIAILLVRIFRQKRNLKRYREVFLVGLLFVAVQLTYLLVRKDVYSVSANIVIYPVSRIILGCVGIFASTTGGLILIKDAKKKLVSVLGMLLAVLPQFLLTGFYFANITITNIMLRAKNPTPLWLWNYNAFWLVFSVLAFECLAILAFYRTVIADKQPLYPNQGA
jgi:hypothetical protein